MCFLAINYNKSGNCFQWKKFFLLTVTYSLSYKDKQLSTDVRSLTILQDGGHFTEDLASAPQDCQSQEKQGGSTLPRAAAAAAAAAKSLQSCLTLCDPMDCSPPGSPASGTLQARTRVGCRFLLQCMKVKSESEVAQSCPTPSDPTDCSLPGCSVHGICQARVLQWAVYTRRD